MSNRPETTICCSQDVQVLRLSILPHQLATFRQPNHRQRVVYNIRPNYVKDVEDGPIPSARLPALLHRGFGRKSGRARVTVLRWWFRLLKASLIKLRRSMATGIEEKKKRILYRILAILVPPWPMIHPMSWLVTAIS